jgi:hypothetical protein
MTDILKRLNIELARRKIQQYENSRLVSLLDRDVASANSCDRVLNYWHEELARNRNKTKLL